MKTTHNILIKELLSDYTVTEDGRFYSPRGRSGKCLKGKQREIIPRKDSYGYLCLSYKRKTILVHRVIYQAFIGELDERLEINHINGNKADNSLENLEQVSSSENSKHKYRALGYEPVVGYSKINRSIAEGIREDRRNGAKYKELMEKYNLCKSNISYICNYRTWNR